MAILKSISLESVSADVKLSETSGWERFQETSKRMFTLEYLVDLALIYPKGALLLTKTMMNHLQQRVKELRELSMKISQGKVDKTIGEAIEGYERTIPFHLRKEGVLPAINKPDDLDKYLVSSYTESKYLDKSFQESLGFSWSPKSF